MRYTGLDALEYARATHGAAFVSWTENGQGSFVRIEDAQRTIGRAQYADSVRERVTVNTAPDKHTEGGVGCLLSEDHRCMICHRQFADLDPRNPTQRALDRLYLRDREAGHKVLEEAPRLVDQKVEEFLALSHGPAAALTHGYRRGWEDALRHCLAIVAGDPVARGKVHRLLHEGEKGGRRG